MNDDGDGVKGDRQFDKRDAILATGLEFFCRDRPRGIGQWDISLTELSESSRRSSFVE